MSAWQNNFSIEYCASTVEQVIHVETYLWPDGGMESSMKYAQDVTMKRDYGVTIDDLVKSLSPMSKFKVKSKSDVEEAAVIHIGSNLRYGLLGSMITDNYTGPMKIEISCAGPDVYARMSERYPGVNLGKKFSNIIFEKTSADVVERLGFALAR